MKRVFCLGDCNVDLLTPVDEMPVKGGHSFSGRLSVNMGGSVLNTAAALQKLEVPVSIVSKIGDDMFGDYIMSFLRQNDFDTRCISRSPFPTGVVIGLVEPDGEKRAISIRKNAADLDIRLEDIQGYPLPEILYITGVMLAEGEESRRTAIGYARRVRENGGQVFLDPNIRRPSWFVEQGIKDAFELIYPSVDCLLLNEKELLMLSGEVSPQDAAQKTLDKGIAAIWLKNGVQGSRYITGNQTLAFKAIDVQAVDTTGAGDAFNAAVIYSLMQGHTPKQTGEFASRYAGYTVARFGTTCALPGRQEVGQMLKEAMQ